MLLKKIKNFRLKVKIIYLNFEIMMAFDKIKKKNKKDHMYKSEALEIRRTEKY